MKNLIVALMLILGFASFSVAGECANGLCTAPLFPVRKVVNVTREIVVAPVRAVGVIVTAPVRAVASSRNCCTETVASNTECGCDNTTSTKTVVKYQPVRRRLVNRSTVVSNCGCQ